MAQVAESSGRERESQIDSNYEKERTKMPWITSSNHGYSVLVQEISIDLD